MIAMNSIEQAAQNWIDAVADPAVRCEGRLLSYSTMREGPSNKPNCGVCGDCPLFKRNVPYGTPQKLLFPSATGNPERGCQERIEFEIWSRSQQLWIVKLDGFDSVEVRAGDAMGAAVRAFMDLHAAGENPDKMILFEKRYSVREV